MPRQGRLDYQGTLHHVICRGVSGCNIFRDTADRDKFLAYLGKLIVETKSGCLAWALMPNHFHLLMVTGADSLAHLMQRLLTRHAVCFNRKYNRHGHLFQNRYKAIICESDVYLLQLVRYIHLNPIRGGLIADMAQLRKSPLVGHGVILGDGRNQWQDVQEVLIRFGNKRKKAVRAYETFVGKGIKQGEIKEYEGGGLIRRAGILKDYSSGKNMPMEIHGDTRVLGSNAFVREVLRAASEKEQREHSISRKRNPGEIIKQAAATYKLTVDDIRGNNRHPQLVNARSLACKWLAVDLGMNGRAIAKILGMKPTAVSRGIERGKRLALDRGLVIK